MRAAKEELKSQGQSLESTRQALSKREVSSTTVISSTVTHAAALFKSHLPDLDMEILHKDFTIEKAECKTLVTSAYAAAQDFVSSSDFARLVESKDNDSSRTL
jgi:hypothetical protein